MTVNACCHRTYNIKGTEIQIKMFDDLLVFESPGCLPGMVKPANIRYTHFSRNPKIAMFLKAYHFVKEFGEGLDRICRELEANGVKSPSFRTDDFILKISVPKVAENRTERLPEKVKTTFKAQNRVNEKIIEKVIEKSALYSETLTKNRITILELMIENPYISIDELSECVGISRNSISRNIEIMRGKYLRRVGPVKGGFWEILPYLYLRVLIARRLTTSRTGKIDAARRPL